MADGDNESEKKETKKNGLDLESILKILSALGAVVVFAWGVLVWWDNAEKAATSRRIEVSKPFFDRQLKLYTEATKAAATIATSSDSTEVKTATKRFWELYWGELALVESREVAQAMSDFGVALQVSQSKLPPNAGPHSHPTVPGNLKLLSLILAHTCRESMSKSWGVDAWKYDATVAPPVSTE